MAFKVAKVGKIKQNCGWEVSMGQAEVDDILSIYILQLSHYRKRGWETQSVFVIGRGD